MHVKACLLASVTHTSQAVRYPLKVVLVKSISLLTRSLLTGSLLTGSLLASSPRVSPRYAHQLSNVHGLQATGLAVILSGNCSNVLCLGETEQHQEAGQEGGEASQKGSAAPQTCSTAFQRGDAASQEHSTAIQENGKATQESGKCHQEVIRECVVQLLDRWALPCPEGFLPCCLLTVVWMQADTVEGIGSDMPRPVM